MALYEPDIAIRDAAVYNIYTPSSLAAKIHLATTKILLFMF